jgi:putative chitinase
MLITVDILKAIAPGSKRTNYRILPDLAHWMNYWFPKYDIDKKGEYCHFLSQAAHETDSFNTLEEYASGKAYEGRKDLGNTHLGDGVKFKGRGIFQSTGRFNARLLTIGWNKIPAEENINFEEHPELLELPEYGVWSACQYWTDRAFNDVANMSDEAKIWSKKLNRSLSPFEYISWRINGGFNGLASRLIFYERSQQLIK